MIFFKLHMLLLLKNAFNYTVKDAIGYTRNTDYKDFYKVFNLYIYIYIYIYICC